jgi:tol-pal system protein YbgF
MVRQSLNFGWDSFAMARSQRALIIPFAAALLAVGMAFSPAIAWAQSYGMPPANVGDDVSDGGGGAPAGGGDSGLVVRVGQLEQQVRDLNGQIQQLQFANRQLQDQLKKFQQDIEFRFQELSRKGGRPFPKHSELMDTPAPAQSAAADSSASPVAGAPRSGSRDDAFDPARDPNAPGVPRTLGSTNPAAGSPAAGAETGTASNDDAPITLLSSPHQSADAGLGASPSSSPAPATTGRLPPLSSTTNPSKAGFTTPDGTVIAGARTGAPKEEFDIALAYMKQKDYEDAQRSFAAFVAKNPKSRHASDALYYLGETYYLRGRQREAAEQYLKISTNYASSPRAPEAMLRLGEALHALGAKEQACATFSEVPRKYPRASAAIKAGAQREAKRAQC